MGACASKPRDLDSNAEPAPVENPANSDDKPEAAVTSTGPEDDQKKEKVESKKEEVESKKEEEPLVDKSVPLTHVQQETVSRTTEPPKKKEEEEAKATNTNTNMTNNKPAAPVVAPEAAAAATTEKTETVRDLQPVMTEAPAPPKEDAIETAATMTTAPATTTQAQPREATTTQAQPREATTTQAQPHEAQQSADRKDAPPPLVTL